MGHAGLNGQARTHPSLSLCDGGGARGKMGCLPAGQFGTAGKTRGGGNFLTSLRAQTYIFIGRRSERASGRSRFRRFAFLSPRLSPMNAWGVAARIAAPPARSLLVRSSYSRESAHEDHGSGPPFAFGGNHRAGRRRAEPGVVALGRAVSAGKRGRATTRQSLSLPYLVYLTPVGDDGVTPVRRRIRGRGQAHFPERGLGFYHPKPLPYRRMIASLESGARPMDRLPHRLELVPIHASRLVRKRRPFPGGRCSRRSAAPKVDRGPSAPGKNSVDQESASNAGGHAPGSRRGSGRRRFGGPARWPESAPIPPGNASFQFGRWNWCRGCSAFRARPEHHRG